MPLRLLWLGIHYEQLTYERQVGLLVNWLSLTISCAGAGSPILGQRYADVRLIQCSIGCGEDAVTVYAGLLTCEKSIGIRVSRMLGVFMAIP